MSRKNEDVSLFSAFNGSTELDAGRYERDRVGDPSDVGWLSDTDHDCELRLCSSPDVAQVARLYETELDPQDSCQPSSTSIGNNGSSDNE